MTVHSAARIGRDGPTMVEFQPDSFEAVSRILEGEAVLDMQIRIDAQPVLQSDAD